MQLTFRDITGEAITEMRADASWTIGSVARKLAKCVGLPAGKIYQLVLGVEPLPAGDTLSSHVTGESAELIACAESEDSDDGSSADSKQGKKRKVDSKAKSKKAKKSSKKKDNKKKGKKDKKKKGKSSSSSSSGNKKKKKKFKDEVVLDEKELAAKNQWVAERLDQLRQIRPPLSAEQCLVRAQKEWLEHKKTLAEDKEKEETSGWPPIVHEARRQAEEEAKAAGKSESEIKEAVKKAGEIALQVAKDNGLYKDPKIPEHEDPTKVPLFFQNRPGLEKAVAYLQKED